jgi:Tfp pilus assembly protein PilF
MARHRLALVAGLTLAVTVSLATPGLAQTGGLAAQSARINALRTAGKYAEALPLAQAMVASLEKTNNNRDLAAALNNLAQIYADQGHDDQAEPIYKRAIALMEKGTGLDSVEIAPVLNNLAALDQRQGRFAEAEPLFKRALAIREKALSREHPDVGQSLNNLATLYVKQEHFADAEPLFQRALAIFQKVGGPEHPAVATLLNNLGQLYRDLNRDADAEAPIRRSLAISTISPFSMSTSSAVPTPSRSIAARSPSASARLGLTILTLRHPPAIWPISSMCPGESRMRCRSRKRRWRVIARSCAWCCRSCSPRVSNLCCRVTRHWTRHSPRSSAARNRLLPPP